jgi:hypothetical protein
MKFWHCYFWSILFIAFTAFGCSKSAKQDFYLGGIMINEANHDEWATSLIEAGMNTVSTTVYARQGKWNNDNIWWNEEEAAVESEIIAAKKQGLKVVLILRVLLDHYFEENKFLWHGMVMPENDSLIYLWFEHYAIFVEKWAVKAEHLGVDALCIGSELRALSGTLPTDSIPPLLEYYLNEEKQQEFIEKNNNFEERLRANDLWVRGYGNYEDLSAFLFDKSAKNRAWAQSVGKGAHLGSLSAFNRTRQMQDSLWRELIESTRQVYTGKISYAANFDNYHNVGFWDALDFMSVNAYFPLRELGEELTTENLRHHWNMHLNEMTSFQQNKVGRLMPVMFTELGYTGRSGCTFAPWEGFGYSIVSKDDKDSLFVWDRQEVDLHERAMAVSALQEACINDSLFDLEGILYWKLTSDSGLLQYEPFGLSIAPGSTDELLAALQSFIQH